MDTILENLGTIIAIIILWPIVTAFLIFMWKLGIPWIIVWFAERDIWWSPLRMEPAPGHINMLTRGRKLGGPFDRVLAGHIPYWHYHEGDRRFYKEGPEPAFEGDRPFVEKFPEGTPVRSGYLASIKVLKVGFFRRYYRRRRRWESWELMPGSKQYGLVEKEMGDKEDHIFYFSTTMAERIGEIPTSDFFPVSFTNVFNVLMIHPEKAEFVAGKWEVRANAAVRSRSREYVGVRTVHDLRNERDTGGADYVDTILMANFGGEFEGEKETGTSPLLPTYGIALEGPQLIDPDFESGDVEMTAATRRILIAEEDVKTARVRADEAEIRGQGKARERAAEAEGIRAEYAARASAKGGEAFSIAEAVKGGNLKALSFGSGGIIASIDTEK